MIKKKFINVLVLFLFLSGCGYSPIFSTKKSNFSIYEISANGDSKLNKIINSELNNYKGSDSLKKFSLNIETSLNKDVVSRDSKGNPKTFRMNLKSNVLIKNVEGNVQEKSFSKSVDYNNRSNKFELKKYEDQTSKILAEKISDEIIVYLQSI